MNDARVAVTTDDDQVHFAIAGDVDLANAPRSRRRSRPPSATGRPA